MTLPQDQSGDEYSTYGPALTPGAADAIKYNSKRRSEAHRTLPGVERGAAANPTAPRGSGSEATEI